MRRLGLAVAVAVAALTGMEIHTRVPVAVVPPDLALPADTRELTLIFHGSVDGDNPQFPALAAALAVAPSGTGAAVRFVRWDPPSDVRLRAAATARSLGKQLGTDLAGLAGLTTVRLIAHSSGAFVPDALCEAYRAGSARPARVEMVLLDAFQISGFVDWGYGARNHGRCADFALSVFNTDDPAPATDRPLQQAWNLDVTAHPARAGYERNGHYWPVEFLLTGGVALVRGLPTRSHRQLPRGAVVAVSDPCEPC
ncbi:MAG: hypothetical protein KJ041_06970 [Gammaproteobacteria bacterium]|nr:hypothetical protein [Gammaproteobacteria bacterium]